MPARPLLLALALMLIAAAAQMAGAAVGAPVAVVASITDGDTLTLTNGRRVRLLQVDSPEPGECYAKEARATLLALSPIGSTVVLETDARLDTFDRYGRLLRYVRRGRVDVNLELVRRGAAAPYFYRGERGRHARRLLEAARAAKAARRGLWGASPSTVFDPERQVETGRCGTDPHRLDGDGDGLGCE